QPPGDLPRPAGVPCPQAGLRGMRAGQGLSVLRHRAHRSAAGRATGQGTRDRAPARTGRPVAGRPMSVSARWSVVAMVIVLALAAALWAELDGDGDGART